MSLRSRFVLALLISVMITSMSMGLFSFYHARNALYERVIKSELPIHLTQVKNKIDSDINLITANAKTLANNPFILDWINRDSPKLGEDKLIALLGNIKQQFGLEIASWGDRKTHKYWDQNGFSRQLSQGKDDDWFFDFIQSDQESNINIDPKIVGKGFVLYVNYQNKNGRGLTDFGITLDNIINYIENIKIGETGFVYLVDKKGTIMVHKNTALLDKQTLASVYGEQASHKLLDEKQFKVINKNDRVIASQYIPSLGWYLVAEVPNDSVYGVDSSMSNMGKDVIILAIILTLLSGLAASLIVSQFEAEKV